MITSETGVKYKLVQCFHENKIGDMHEEIQSNFILLCSNFVSWLCGRNFQKCEQRYKNVYQSLIMAYTKIE